MSQHEAGPSASAQPSAQDDAARESVRLAKPHTPPHGSFSKVRPWSSSDPPRFPLRTPDVDPWQACLDKSKIYDKGRIELWRDEVDKVLLFVSGLWIVAVLPGTDAFIQSALFSAIVTAFTVESSKLLRVDHQESSAAILYAIHKQLDSIARQNTTNLPSVMPDPLSTFEVPPYAVTVNTFWFLSLTFSLTTAALGIFCLQWLREHQKEPSGSPSDVFPLLVLRIHRIDQWGVGSAIGLLPVLLLLSLFLFLGGLGIMLTQFGHLLRTFVSRVVFAIYLVFFILVFLPAFYPDSAFRTPQAWFFRASLMAPLTPILRDTGLDRAWSSLGERLAGPVSYTTRRFVNLEDWNPSDRDRVKKSRDFGFQWFATAFAHDRQAIHALVQCVEMQIHETQDNGTVEEIEEDIKIRMEEMVSLEAGQPRGLRDHAALVQMPAGMAYDVVMAYCIDYATQKHPSLALAFSVRRLELQLRILSTSLREPLMLPTTGIIRFAIDNFAFGCYESLRRVKAFPEGE